MRAHFNLGNVADTQKRPEAAIAHYRRVLELEPNHIGAANNLGLALGSIYRLEEAVAVFKRILSLQPNNADAHNNLGRRCTRQEFMTKRRSILPERYSSTRTTRLPNGIGRSVIFRRGMHEGFKAYEARLPCRERRRCLRSHSRCGMGRACQDAPFSCISSKVSATSCTLSDDAPLLRECGATVLLICPENLHRLLGELPSVAAIFVGGEILPHFDVHCPLASLPLQFGTTLETIPNSVPYIFPDQKIAEAWKRRLDQFTPGFRVGLSWAGSPAGGYLWPLREMLAPSAALVMPSGTSNCKAISPE